MTFDQRRAIALEILNRNVRLTRKSGSFLGQLCCDPTTMSPAQAKWFATLAERAGIELEADLHD